MALRAGARQAPPAWSFDPTAINDYIDQVLRWVPGRREREAMEIDLLEKLPARVVHREAAVILRMPVLCGGDNF